MRACTVWDGVILLRHGLYQGGMFKFKISIDTGYPVTPPSITFLSRVYHPLIDPETGELSIKVGMALRTCHL